MIARLRCLLFGHHRWVFVARYGVWGENVCLNCNKRVGPVRQ